MILDQLPERGWGVLRCNWATILVLHEAGLAKVQVTYQPGVYQARLTGKGRRFRAKVQAPADLTTPT